jgi:threonine/homoserine/homoserine lactone efflux protein
MIELLGLISFSFALGFLAAIPVGGSQIEMAKRALFGFKRSAQMVVLGSVTSDIIYGVIALYGIAPFFNDPRVQAGFNVLGSVVLWVLAFFTYRESKKDHIVNLSGSSLENKKLAYVTGFTLAFSNPPMMLSWLMGLTLAKHIGLTIADTNLAKGFFIISGAMGLGSYLLLLGVFVGKVKHFIPTSAFGRIYATLAVILFLLSFYFVYGAVQYFTG